MIEAHHTPEQCMQTLDEFEQQSQPLLEQARFGCRSGEHTAWAMVEASSEDEARTMLPRSMRGTSRVVRVERMTPERIREMHRAA